MAASNTPSTIDTLLDHLNRSELSINLNFIKMSQVVDNSISLISEVKGELRKHTQCSSTNSTNSRNFTWLSLEKLLDALYNSNHYSVVKNTLKNNATPIVIASCDGGLRSLNSVIYSVASFSFGQVSNLYGCTNVRQSVDSTHSELVAVFDLLTQALTNHLDKINIVIDNQAALLIVTLALTTTLFDSIELQRFIQKKKI